MPPDKGVARLRLGFQRDRYAWVVLADPRRIGGRHVLLRIDQVDLDAAHHRVVDRHGQHLACAEHELGLVLPVVDSFTLVEPVADRTEFAFPDTGRAESVLGVEVVDVGAHLGRHLVQRRVHVRWRHHVHLVRHRVQVQVAEVAVSQQAVDHLRAVDREAAVHVVVRVGIAAKREIHVVGTPCPAVVDLRAAPHVHIAARPVVVGVEHVQRPVPGKALGVHQRSRLGVVRRHAHVVADDVVVHGLIAGQRSVTAVLDLLCVEQRVGDVVDEVFVDAEVGRRLRFILAFTQIHQAVVDAVDEHRYRGRRRPEVRAIGSELLRQLVAQVSAVPVVAAIAQAELLDRLDARFVRPEHARECLGTKGVDGFHVHRALWR